MELVGGMGTVKATSKQFFLNVSSFAVAYFKEIKFTRLRPSLSKQNGKSHLKIQSY
jgi:hypothetical protein